MLCYIDVNQRYAKVDLLVQNKIFLKTSIGFHEHEYGG